MNCAPFQTMVMRNNHGGNEPCTDQGLGLLWDYIMLFSFCTELFYKKRKSRPEFVPDESVTRLTEPSSFDNTEEQGSCNEYASEAQKMSEIKTPVRPGGRLENYVKEDEDINELNSKAVRTLRHLDECIRTAGSPAPYDLAIILENEYDRFWKSL